MDCHIIPVEQGSDEWLDLRRCRITASRLADVMAKPTTLRYQNYRREKVLELLGHEAVEERPEWAEHGRALEPRALAAYEWKFNANVEHDLFLVSKEYDWLAASPDLLELPEGDDIADVIKECREDEILEGGEIKCRHLRKNYNMHVHMAKFFEGTVRASAPESRHQIQGNMWLTGLPRWGLINYYEGEGLDGEPVRKLHRVWIPRDEALISDMEVRCLEFWKEVHELAMTGESI